jgi:translocation and assembly module TamB
VELDSVQARLTIADGMLDVRSLRVATGFAGVEAQGTFGLVPGQLGTLTYRARVDSLQGFSRWIPGASDTARVSSRPRGRQQAVERARADSAALAKATEVERAITGAAGPSLEIDTIATFRKDSISGSLYAAGTLRGNLDAFEVRGRAMAEKLVLLGNSITSARSEYALVRADTGLPRVAAGVGMRGVSAAGFLFDSAEARLTYDGGAGSVAVAVHQDGNNHYLARGDFELNLDGGVLRYSDLDMRFDTTTWVAAHPAAIHWGAKGLRVDSVDLRSGDSGRILVDGEIPDDGPLNLQVEVTRLQLGDISTLLQGDMDTRALLTTKARIEGTRDEPRVSAALGLTDVMYLGSPAPDLRATLTYADRRLESSIQAGNAGAPPLAVASASLGVDLSLSGSVPSLDQAPLVVDVTMDSLPLDVVPSLTSAISDLRGIVRGKLAIRGTPAAPHPVGAFSLELGSLRLTASGTRITDVQGAIRIEEDTLVVEQLHGRTPGGGTIEIAGGMDITNLSAPGFDIIMDAQHALLLDNDLGHVYADAGLDVHGPFDGVVVEGGIKVLNGVVYIPKPESRTAVSPSDPAVFAVLDTSSAFGRELLAEQSPLMENMRLDVAVFVERGVFARSTEANLEIHTPEDPLRVSFNQRTGELRVLGTVATERGTYAVAGRRFDISRGSVLFIGTEEIDPIIQIVGERQIDLPGREALQIQVLIGGTALNPRLTLESNAQPPISQTDLLSYLAFGRSTGSLLQTQGSALSGQGTASGQLVGSVAALATRQLAAVAMGAAVQELQQDAARQLGADVFNITPADVPNELSATGVQGLLKGTEIEAGKYFSPETFVATQLRPASGQVLGLRVEQRLPKGFRIEASFEPRFLLREPSLAQQDPARPVRVIGAFLVWDRRF